VLDVGEAEEPAVGGVVAGLGGDDDFFGGMVVEGIILGGGFYGGGLFFGRDSVSCQSDAGGNERQGQKNRRAGWRR
jgi:hypothetical protein